MRTDRRKALIGRLLVITCRRGAVAPGRFPGAAAAARRAAIAPAANHCVTGNRDEVKRRWAC